MADLIDNIKTLAGEKKEKEEQGPQKPKIKVLIVEDEAPLADALEAEFKENGFDAIKAQNGKAGLEMVIAEKPDLIVLDLLMPIMDGKDMLRKVRSIEEFKRLPVIVLTNAGEVENIRQTQTYDNAEEFLIKSNVTMDQIINKAKILTGFSTG